MRTSGVPAGGLISVIGLWSAVGALCLVLSAFLTNPAALGPVGVTLWFVTLFLTLAGILALTLYLIKQRWGRGQMPRRSLANSWRQGMLLSVWLSVMLALSSLRQFTWRDGLLLLLLVGLLELYARARS